MQYKVLEMGNGTTKTGKPYKKLKIEGTDGNHNVNIFSDFPDYANITFGSTIDGTIEQNGQYENIRSSVQTANAYKKPNFDRIMEKKQDGIAQSQEKKALNIAEAQDRSAWMWAKNNATILVASDKLKDSNFSSGDAMVAEVIRLATKIYLGEPTEPF